MTTEWRHYDHQARLAYREEILVEKHFTDNQDEAFIMIILEEATRDVDSRIRAQQKEWYTQSALFRVQCNEEARKLNKPRFYYTHKVKDMHMNLMVKML